YLEIQAGLAATQLERLPMPARAEWTWLEGYGLLGADPGEVHSADWARARQAAEITLEQLMPRQEFEAEFRQGQAVVDQQPVSVLHHGSGWGTLERLRREKAGEPPFATNALVFDEAALGESQHPWLELLTEGQVHPRDPDDEPTSYMIQNDWH